MSVYALDFDGVICDSRQECLVNSHNVYKNASIRSLDELDPVVAKRAIEKRYLVGPAREYWLLWHLVENGPEKLTLKSFELEKKNFESELEDFEPKLFEHRNQIRSENLSLWLSWHHRYPEFDLGWERIKNSSNYIVTTKDLTSVQTLFDEWKIPFDEDRIYSKERMSKKSKALSEIAARESCSPNEIQFVDDNVLYLSEIAPLGFSCYWAKWGYIPPKEEYESYVQSVAMHTISNLSEVPS